MAAAPCVLPNPVPRDPAATTIEDNVDPVLSPAQGTAHYHWKIFL